ncbi:MAG TPA: hypothetical protein VFK05_19310 [Polyangiaceae bacterium]|nr:hypothetical protein [Polyangiaceae bacterium]
MAVDKGDRSERAARGMFIGALALACGACGGGRHHEPASAGNTSAGGSVDSDGAGTLGGRSSSAGNAGAGDELAAAGAAAEGGASSVGGESAQAGTGLAGGMAGEQATQPGGTSPGGASSGGRDALGGATSGGTSSGGTSSGGMEASGGTTSGGMDGMAGTSSGGANSGGAPASCGDALLDAAEECDDGNDKNLDGCSAACRYELAFRMTTIAVQGASAPAFCSPSTNALGRAFSSAALSQINTALQQSISDGTLNNLLQFTGLDDLTGASDDSSLAIGFLPAAPDSANGPWAGGTAIDLWFRVPSASVDAQGAALSSLSGTLSAHSLGAGPGLLKLPLAIGGAPSTLSMSSARLRATLNASPEPNVPAPPPAALAPGLTVLQSIAGSGSGQGICGNVTVDSLAHIPVPASLASGGASACAACTGSRAYKACSGNTVESGCNSMLDVLVGGCKTLLCLVSVVTASQPDVAAPGSAAVRPLSLGTGNAVPSSQSTGNDDAYSSYFKFDANRAHITGVQ